MYYCVCLSLCLQPKCNSFLGNNSQQGYSKHLKSLSCLTCRARQAWQATSSHEIDVLRPYRTCFSNRALQEHRATSFHEFGVVRPFQTHECLWPYTLSCCTRLLKQVWCASTQPNLPEQQSTTRASMRPETRMISVWFFPTESAWATDHNYCARVIILQSFHQEPEPCSSRFDRSNHLEPTSFRS